MLRKFLKDSAAYAIPTIISRGLSFILVPLYTRVLSPADFGSLDLLLVFASLVNLTIALEVSQGVARFFAAEIRQDRKVAYASSAFWFTLGCYSVFAALMLMLTPYIASVIMGQAGLELAFQFGVIYMWSNGLFCLVLNQFRWELRSSHYTIVSLVMAFATGGVSVWFAYFQNWGLIGLLFGMAAGCLTATALGLWWLRDSVRLYFDTERLKEMLAFSTPLVFSGIAVWVSLYIDRMMIKYLLSIEEVGLYGIGSRLASVSTLAIVGFQAALTPLIYANYKNPDTPRQLEQIFRLFLSFALLVYLVLTLFAIDILVLMATPEFYGGAIVVMFLVPAILLGNMYIFAPGIGIAKKTHLIVWINVMGGLLNIGLNYWLIPIFGIRGAGVATMMSYGGIFAAYTFFGQRFYPIPHNWTRIFAAMGVAALIAGMLPHLTLPNTARWIANILGILAFTIVALSLGLIKQNEISSGWRLFISRVSARV